MINILLSVTIQSGPTDLRSDPKHFETDKRRDGKMIITYLILRDKRKQTIYEQRMLYHESLVNKFVTFLGITLE